MDFSLSLISCQNAPGLPDLIKEYKFAVSVIETGGVGIKASFYFTL